jgi:hypothetical protein
MADNVITNLSIEVTASADKAASMFDRLASSSGRVKGAASGAAGGMRDMAQGARDAGTATATAGEQAGQAQPKIRGIGKDAKDAGNNAKKGASGLSTFWQSLKRIAFYRFVRSIIKEVTEAFKTGITNLYHWSDLVNGHFAASMDRLATSSQYLKNSLGAMVSPLIETLVPVLDVIIDKVVDVLNFFNMLVSAVSGSDTYTVAKKAAAVWDDSANKTKKAAKSAANELKRTILGFDEINKLVKQSNPSSGSGSSSSKKEPDYGSMFEEKPLTGIFKKISEITSGWPDWLKALLGIGAAGLAIFGIPALLKKIFDGLKKLFLIKIPDWFRWLFGPKGNGDGDGGIDLSDKLKLPDGDIKVKLDTDDLEEIKIPVSPMKTGDELFKDLRTDWNKNKTTLFVNDKLLDDGDELFKALRTEWNKNKTTLFVSVMLLKTGFDLFKELRGLWNKGKTTLFADVRLLKTGGELFKELRTDWNKVKTTLMIDVKLLKTGSDLFKELRTEWNRVKTTLFVPEKLLDSGEELFKEFRTSWNRTKTTMFVDVKLLKTGEELFKELRTSWNTTKTTLFVEVGLIKKDWTTVHDYVDKNFGETDTNVGFGGALSGGGSTAGGGAGRGRHSTLGSFSSVDIGVNYVANGNKSYKNSTLGKYLTDTMAKVKSEATTKVKSVAGTLTKIVSDKLVPITGDTETKNTVNGTAGSFMTRAMNKFTAVVGNTDTINTVSGRAGLGMKLAGMAYQNIVGDTSTTNTVKGAPGAGMAYTWDGFKPITQDTITTNTVKAAPGAGMTYTWDGFKPITQDTITTNTVKAAPGTNMSGGGWLGGLLPKVSDTTTTNTVNAKAGSNMNSSWYDGLSPNVSDTSATARIDVSAPWLSWGRTLSSWIGMDDLKSTAWVDVQTPWWYWGRSLLSWLGMDNLSTTVTVNAVAGTGGGGGGAKMATKAKGGIFSNGAWSDIPQYAGGKAGVNHGSLFWAGENGAEIVGNAGGRTEVLNRSQIASAMYSAVQAAMAPAAANFASAAESMGSVSIGFDIETLAEMVRQGVEQAMSRSNDLDRQRNEYLRQINDKDFTAEVTSNDINNAQRRMNRRAGTTVVAVG